MQIDEYVLGIINQYRVIHDANSPAVKTAQMLFPSIKTWANNYLVEVRYSGSTAKGTAIRGSTDLDLFISLSPDTPGSLSDIYGNLYNCTPASWFPRKQDVSIGITFNGMSVDLVPGRKQRGNTSDHSLYRNKGKTWIQTNVEEHIKLITESGRLDEIRATKIWRKLHNLEFPSFYLEMSVLSALYRKPTTCLASNFVSVLEYLRDNFEEAAVVDPANSNNSLSDLLTSTEKRTIASLAARHLALNWNQVLW